jgi:hypothetical protein
MNTRWIPGILLIVIVVGSAFYIGSRIRNNLQGADPVVETIASDPVASPEPADISELTKEECLAERPAVANSGSARIVRTIRLSTRLRNADQSRLRWGDLYSFALYAEDRAHRRTGGPRFPVELLEDPEFKGQLPEGAKTPGVAMFMPDQAIPNSRFRMTGSAEGHDTVLDGDDGPYWIELTAGMPAIIESLEIATTETDVDLDSTDASLLSSSQIETSEIALAADSRISFCLDYWHLPKSLSVVATDGTPTEYVLRKADDTWSNR